MSSKSKKQYLFDFFKNNPNKVYKLKEIDALVRQEYEEATGSSEIYVNRTPRDLVKRGYIDELGGYIERPSKGKYIFKKGRKKKVPKSPFPQSVKNKIKKKDQYKCAWCGIPETSKEILAVDHIVPEDKGGKGEFDNGITLCNSCNNTKKNLGVSSFGSKVFKKYLAISKKQKDQRAIEFLEELLEIFKKHNLN